MAGPWEQYAAPAAKEPAASAGPWDSFKAEAPKTDVATAPPPLKRTLRQAASDMGASVVEGTGQLLGGMAELTNVVTGGIADKVVRKAQGALNRTLGGVGGDGPGITGAYAGLQEEVEGEKSEVLRTKQRELADTKGFFGSAKKVLSDPTLLTAELAKQVPNLAIMGGGAAPTLARGLAGAEARGLTGAAAETAARRTLERQIVGTAAIQEAGPAALQARQAVEALPQEVWDTNPDYQRRIAAGESADEVKASMGQWAATKAAVIGGIAGAVGGKLTAGLEGKFFTRGLEKASVEREFATNAVKAVGREAAEEAIQEGGSQIGSNVGVQGVDASQDLLEGVPEAAGTGAALGGVMGGGISVVNPATSRTMPDGQPLPDPAAGVLSRTVNMAADFGALEQAALKQVSENEAAALEGRANKEDPRPVESRMPSRPWVDETTGIDREPTDDEIKLTLHQYLAEVAAAGTRPSRKAVTASLAVGAKRANTILDRVINERKNGVTAETYAAQQSEVSDAPSAGRTESPGTDVDRAVDDGGSRGLFDAVPDRAAVEAAGSAAAATDPASGLEPTVDEDPDAELSDPYQIGAAPERTADYEIPAKRPPTNLDPETGELLGIDAEAWPSAPAHQQPKAIIAAIAAQGRANDKKKPPGITLISETYGVDLDVARALRNRAVREMAAPVSAAGASTAKDASASPAASVQPGAADASTPALSADGSAPAARGAAEVGGEAGALASAPVGDRAQDTPVQAEGAVYDESEEVQDDDITPSSGGAFTARGAADIQAKRHKGGKVFEVDGGFVVRTPKAAEGLAAPAAPDSSAGGTGLRAAQLDGRTDPPAVDIPRPQPGLESPSLPSEPEKLRGGNRPSPQATPGAGAVQAAAAEAATSSANDLPEPTTAQKEAGNYKKGHARVAGLDVAIENPAGSRRRPEWPPLKHHYGYIKGTIGKDKDHVDVFLTEAAEDPSLPVFVIDQVTKSGRFDEHKVVMGAADEASARTAYLDNYAKGWTGLGGITQMTQDEFKAWVKDPSKTLKRAAAKNAIPMAEESAIAGDRRTNTDARARVAALPADEQKTEIESLRTQLAEANKRADTDARTGLKNPSAFDRDVGAAGAVATIDLKLFKGYNSLLTDKGGDAVLAAVGEAMRGAGVDAAYRRGGDEFAFLAADTKAAEAMLSRFSDRAAAISLTVQVKGTAYTVTGVPFTAGVGTDEESAIAARDASKGDYDRNAHPDNVRADPVQGDAGADPEGASGREGNGRASTAPEVGKTSKSDKIEDFGETLHGARKHYAHAYGDRFKEALELDVAANPLSKTWPEPDYEKLLEVGTDPFVVAWIHAARDEIPTKPSSSWKLRGWVANVEALRGMADRLLAGDITPDRLRDALAKPEFVRVNDYIGGRADLYQEVGHAYSLKGISLQQHHYSLYHGKENVKLWSVDKKAKATAFSNWPTELGVGATKEEAIAAFKKTVGALQPSAAKEKGPTRFTIYSYRGQPKFVIGKKIGKSFIDLETFDSAADARTYLSDHQAELEAKLKKMTDIPQERRASNEPRIGVDHRSGADVKPEQFAETFGFRGVQFGNYVEGSRRQQDLNNAYDALLDMAGVLGVPPRALSLNGTLGLAFGARGKGGKNAPSAHYEPTNIVINLTKGAGAGSLAHEWWHGLDNYFGVMRAGAGKFGRADTYATESARARPDLGQASEGNLRPELMRAFTRVSNMVHETGIRERSALLDKLKRKAYWSTGREMTARSFESYIIARLADQNAANDYLANVVSEESFAIENGYPYPTAGEIASVRGAYDDFFKTIDNEETPEGNVRLFSKAGDAGSDRADWGDMPAVVIANPFGPEQRRLSGHADYVAAKAGDDDAALRLVRDFVTPAVVDRYRALVGDRTPLIVPVLAQEATGANRIPLAFAAHLAQQLGLEFDAGIVQSNRVHHTGAGAYHRLAFQPTFDGAVESGADYLILDDAVTVGGTLANIRGHIVANGGNVIGAGVLTGHPNGVNIALSDATAQRMREDFGDELETYLQDEFGFGISQLTEGEAGQIRAARTVDEFRNRITQARDAALGGLPPKASFSRSEVANGPPKAGRSASGGLSFDHALKLKKELTSKWGANAPNVILVQSAEDFPASAKTDPDYRRGEGFYEGKQTVWINVGRIRSSQRFAQVLAHEALGHFGVERIVGEAQWDGIVDTIERLAQTRGGSAQTRAVIAEVRTRYPDVDRVTFAKEAIAVMAEKGIRNSIVERVVAAVRRWLRSAMPSMPWKELDVRALLAQSDSFLRVGQAREQSVRTVQAYSFARGGVLAKVDGRGQRTIEMGGETFADRSGKFYMINGTGQPKDIRSLGEATELAKRTGGDVLVDEAIEGERPSWSVVVPDVVARDAFSKRPLFSKAPEETLADIEAVVQAGRDDTVLERARQRLKDLVPAKVKDQLRPTWLGALTTRHLTELGADYFGNIKHYSDFLAQMGADRNQLATEGEEVVEDARQWAGKHQAEAKELFKLMHDSTIDGVDPSKAFQPLQFRYGGHLYEATPKKIKEAIAAVRDQMRGRGGDSKVDMINEMKVLRGMPARDAARKKKYPSLVERWNALSPNAQKIYQKFAKLYGDRSDAVEEALVARINDTDAAPNQKRKLINLIRQQFETQRLQGIYFPLQRFGRYFVAATKGDTSTFIMFEKQGELERAVKELRTRGFTITAQGLKSAGKSKDAPSGTFVADVMQTMAKAGVSEKTQDDIYQIYLEALPEMSMRKHAIHRRSVPGFDPDAVRGFAFNMHHGAHQLAKLRYGHKLQNVLDVLAKGQDAARRGEKADTKKIVAGDAILQELNLRHDWINNPQDSQVTNLVSSFGFVYYLGATPAAALVNLSQTALVTFPFLAARFGPIKAMNHLLSGMRDSIRTRGNIQKVLKDADEISAHELLQKTGALDKTQAHNLAGIAEGGLQGYNPAWAKAMEIIGWGFHKTEVVNREATGMAAYRLARADGQSFDQAVKFAADAINDTHFDYTNANRARFMQSGTAKTLLMFRQYSLNMTWHLGRMVWNSTKGESPEVKRLARRNLAGVLGMSALFSGALGLPLMSVAMGTLNAIASTFGDDDEPWDAETEFRAFLGDMLGQEAAELLLGGVANPLTGADIASRVSLSQLWFRDADRELDGRGAYYHLLEQAAGPMGGVLKNVLVGKHLIDEGHVMRGVETMLPKGLKDTVKASRYASEGVNNLRGDPLVEDLPLWDTLLQFSGFTPEQVAKQYDVNRALKNYEQAILDRRQRLMDSYAMGVRLGDQEALSEAGTKIMAFNQANPEIAITPKTIKRSLESRMRYSERAEAGIMLNPKIAARVRAAVGVDD